MNATKACDNIFTKLKKLYSDLYISSIGYISALEPNQSNWVLCVLDDGIHDYMKNEIFKSHDDVFLNIDEYRAEGKFKVDKIPDALNTKIDIMDKWIKNDSEWHKMPFDEVGGVSSADIFSENISSVFYPNDKDPFYITKSLFPITTEKNKDSLEYKNVEFIYTDMIKVICIKFQIEGMTIYWFYMYTTYED